MQTKLNVSSRLLKEFSIETKHTRRNLSIYKGDLLNDDSDIISINVYEQGKDYGQLYKSFKKKYCNSYNDERKILSNDEWGWVGVSTSPKNNRHVFYIHSHVEEGEEFSAEQLRSFLKLTFSAISTFLYEGNKSSSLALPVLFRKGIQSQKYGDFIHVFLYEATKFLKRSHSLESLRIYIWNEEDSLIWEDVVSAKTLVDTSLTVGKAEINSLRNEIYTRIAHNPLKNILKEEVKTRLQRECKRSVFDFYQFSYAVYLLIRDILDEICNLHGVPPEWKHCSPWKRIILLKSNRLLVEWLAEYMSSILTCNRLMKNDSFSISVKDKHLYLLQVLQVLSFYEEVICKGEEV